MEDCLLPQHCSIIFLMNFNEEKPSWQGVTCSNSVCRLAKAHRTELLNGRKAQCRVTLWADVKGKDSTRQGQGKVLPCYCPIQQCNITRLWIREVRSGLEHGLSVCRMNLKIYKQLWKKVTSCWSTINFDWCCFEPVVTSQDLFKNFILTMILCKAFSSMTENFLPYRVVIILLHAQNPSME